MNERERHKAIEDRIDRDIQFGCGTGVGLMAWCVFALVMLLVSPEPHKPVFATQVILEMALFGLFTYGLYHRKMWGAIGLLATWGILHFMNWYFRHSILPPLGIIGFVAWYGLYCGLRGVRQVKGWRETPTPA